MIDEEMLSEKATKFYEEILDLFEQENSLIILTKVNGEIMIEPIPKNTDISLNHYIND